MRSGAFRRAFGAIVQVRTTWNYLLRVLLCPFARHAGPTHAVQALDMFLLCRLFAGPSICSQAHDTADSVKRCRMFALGSAAAACVHKYLAIFSEVFEFKGMYITGYLLRRKFHHQQLTKYSNLLEPSEGLLVRFGHSVAFVVAISKLDTSMVRGGGVGGVKNRKTKESIMRSS
jgi:hypothetical protein